MLKKHSPAPTLQRSAKGAALAADLVGRALRQCEFTGVTETIPADEARAVLSGHGLPPLSEDYWVYSPGGQYRYKLISKESAEYMAEDLCR